MQSKVLSRVFFYECEGAASDKRKTGFRKRDPWKFDHLFSAFWCQHFTMVCCEQWKRTIPSCKYVYLTNLLIICLIYIINPAIKNLRAQKRIHVLIRLVALFAFPAKLVHEWISFNHIIFPSFYLVLFCYENAIVFFLFVCLFFFFYRKLRLQVQHLFIYFFFGNEVN